MENSVLFLLSELYGIKSVALLSVSDLPTHPKYDLFNSNIIHPNMEKGMKAMIEFLINLLPKIRMRIK